MPSSNGVSAPRLQQVPQQYIRRLLTWTKNHRVPNHDIIRTRTSGYTTGGVTRESFKVADEASPAVRRLI